MGAIQLETLQSHDRHWYEGPVVGSHFDFPGDDILRSGIGAGRLQLELGESLLVGIIAVVVRRFYPAGESDKYARFLQIPTKPASKP